MAAKTNEAYQNTISAQAALQNAKGKLNSLHDQAAAAKKAVSALLAKAAEGTQTAEEKASLPGLEAARDGFDDRLSAQRKLVAEAEAEVIAANQAHEAEEKRLAAEDAKLAANPSKRVAVQVLDKPGFKTFGEYLVAVAAAAQPGGRIDARLMGAQSINAAASGMSEGSPADGGFFVQQDFSSELLRHTFEMGQILQRVRKITVQGNGLKINAVAENSRVNGSRWGGVQAFWLGEADTKTASSPKFRQMDMNLKKLAGFCFATDELLQDASALEGVIREAFAEEMQFKIEDAIINGTGAGMPMGILNSPAMVTVAIEGGQTIANTSTFIATNLAKMWGRLPGRSQQTAVWLMNQELQAKLFTATLGGTSAVSGIFLPPGQWNSQPFSTIFGRPMLPVEYAAAEGTVGDIILADLSTYLLIDKGAPDYATSMHVRFQNDETAFRFVYRADGAPTWTSPLTPFKGSATQSPYITLGTRA